MGVLDRVYCQCCISLYADEAEWFFAERDGQNIVCKYIKWSGGGNMHIGPAFSST